MRTLPAFSVTKGIKSVHSHCNILYLAMCLIFYVDVKPDPRSCTPDTPGICHQDATCTPVTPYVCSATRPVSYRCECNQGFTGDGIDCTGELLYDVNGAYMVHINVVC